MAHMISVRKNGFAEMAFAGETPWHGLGQQVKEGASIEEWQRMAGLDWMIKQSIVQFQTDGEGIASRMRAYPGRNVLYRSDTGAPLHIPSDGYNIVQPREVLEFFRDLCEQHGFKIHTAGALMGGRKIWALARNGHVQEIAKGDKVRANLLLATSCDGTSKTRAMWTAIRVVCANTLRIALADGSADAVSVSHKSVFDADEVKQELGVLDDSFEAFAKQAQELARKAISDASARSLLQTLFNKPARLTDAPRVAVTADVLPGAQNVAAGDFAALLTRNVGEQGKDAPADARAVERVMTLYKGAGIGSDHAGSAGTAWGLVNAVTEYVDHHAARTQDARLQSAWFGKGADVKASAFDLATAL